MFYFLISKFRFVGRLFFLKKKNPPNNHTTHIDQYMVLIYRISTRLQLRYLCTYELSNFLHIRKTIYSNEMLSLLTFKMRTQVKQHKSGDSISRNLLTVNSCSTKNRQKSPSYSSKMEKKGKELAQFLIAAVYNRFNIIFKIQFGMISKIHYIYYLFSLFRPAILTNFVEIIRLPISGCTIPEKTSCSVYGWGYTGCKKLFLKTK